MSERVCVCLKARLCSCVSVRVKQREDVFMLGVFMLDVCVCVSVYE